MKRFLHLLVALFGCLHLCGGHWGVLQGLAWTRMLVEYSSKDGLKEGARKTFDGEHPCHLCKSIAKEKSKQSQKKEPLTTGHEFQLTHLTLPSKISLNDPPSHDLNPSDFLSPSTLWDGFLSPPPSPPPRSVV